MTNEDRDLSSSPNKNQGYNRSQQQQQTQQVSPIDPGFVHGIPMFNVPCFPVGVLPVTSPYIMHPGYHGSPHYFTNRECNSESDIFPTQANTNKNDTDLVPPNFKSEDNSIQHFQTQSQSQSPAEQENKGYFIMPFFPGQVILPFPGYISQAEETGTVKIEKADNCKDIEKDG